MLGITCGEGTHTKGLRKLGLRYSLQKGMGTGTRSLRTALKDGSDTKKGLLKLQESLREAVFWQFTLSGL